MELCFDSPKHLKERKVSSVVASAAVGFSLISGIIIFLQDPADSARMIGAVCCIGIGILIAIAARIVDSILYRSYSINDAGITIQFGKYRTAFHSWAEVTQICLCTVNTTKSIVSYRDEEVIWCTFGKIRKGPPKMGLRWNDVTFRMMHFKKVLTILYKPERLEEFHKYCHREIPDYR